MRIGLLRSCNHRFASGIKCHIEHTSGYIRYIGHIYGMYGMVYIEFMDGIWCIQGLQSIQGRECIYGRVYRVHIGYILGGIQGIQGTEYIHGRVYRVYRVYRLYRVYRVYIRCFLLSFAVGHWMNLFYLASAFDSWYDVFPAMAGTRECRFSIGFTMENGKPSDFCVR